MKIICQHCNAQFKMSDEKVPKDKTITITCPKCKKPIPINAKDNASNTTPVSETDAESSLDDIIEEGVQTALICEHIPTHREIIHKAIRSLGYHVTEAISIRDALTKMRFRLFNLIILDERYEGKKFEENDILSYIQKLPMAIRRRIFVALITDQFRTFDAMNAYHNSVNMTVSRSQLKEIDKALRKGLSDYDKFYHVFKESLHKSGLN